MTDPTTLPVVDRFAQIIAGLLRAVWGRGSWVLPMQLMGLLYNRISRRGRRFATLVARIQAGTLFPPRLRATPRQPPVAADAEHPREKDKLPRGFAWLCRLLPFPYPYEVAPYGQYLDALLSDPEMQALIAAEPARMGRLLRPLFHMLGVTPDPNLLPTPPVRKRTLPPEVPPAEPDAASRATASGQPSPSPPLPTARPRPSRRQALKTRASILAAFAPSPKIAT